MRNPLKAKMGTPLQKLWKKCCFLKVAGKALPLRKYQLGYSEGTYAELTRGKQRLDCKKELELLPAGSLLDMTKSV